MIFYHNKLGKVAMYSDTRIEQVNLKEFNYSPSKEEMDLINQNYDLFIQDEKLIICKSQGIINEERVKDREIAKDQLKDDLRTGTVTMQNMAALLLKIL